jgi:alkylation response protein AidB-like acyl-CoA dehydrogenase
MVQAVGPYGLPYDAAFLDGETPHAVTLQDDAVPLTPAYLNFRKASIYGGSNEVQKNIINKMILGL